MSDSDKSLYSLRYNQVTSNLEAFGGGTPQWTLVTLNNVDPQQVPITRQIGTTAPLLGGGNLSADRTISIPQASGSADGYLSASDWTIFDTKLSPALTSANIFVGDGSNVAVGVPVTGDIILANTGSMTLTPVNGNVGSFTNANITVDAKGRITAAANGSSGITQLTGDVTAGPGSGSQATTLATVNSNVGSFTYASLTVNAKGLVTAASSGTAPVTSVSGTAGDISSTGGTTPVIDLVNTAVTPGTYTNTTLTVDAKGRLTAASSGTAPVTSVSGTANQITSTGGTTPVLAIANPLTLPGAMTAGGAIAMATNKITGLGNGTAAQDAVAFTQINGFRVLSVNTATSTTNFATTSSTFQTTNLSVTVTPVSSSSKFLVFASGPLLGNGATTDALLAIFRDTTNTGGATGQAQSNTAAGVRTPASLFAFDSPATASAVTYSVKIRNEDNATTVTFGNNGSDQTMIVVEIG